VIAPGGRDHRGDACPLARGAIDLEAATERLHAIAQALQAAADGLLRTADAVVEDLDVLYLAAGRA
jgi:hypothetical protein